jgi:hypothetical protein
LAAQKSTAPPAPSRIYSTNAQVKIFNFAPWCLGVRKNLGSRWPKISRENFIEPDKQ